MTIAKTARRIQYAGNGSTTPFAYPYRFFDDADLEVYITVDATGVQTLQTLTTHYTVSNNGDETGGTVTMVTAPANGETLTILGAVALTQSTDYTGNDQFPAETHEAALDRLTLQVQELQSRLDRALKVQESDATTTLLPSTVDRAGRYAAFDSSGNIVATSGTSSDIVASSFMETVLDDTTGDAALTTLGAGSKGLAIFKDTTSAAVLTELGVTAFAQTLLDDANAASTRATLGLGSAAVAGLPDDADLSNNGTDALRRDNAKAYVDGKFTRETETATTSGTSHSFALTGTVRRVVVMLDGVSLNGATDRLAIRLGTGGVATTTGYVSGAGETGASTNDQTTFAALTRGAAVAANAWSGRIVFEHMGGNIWVWSGTAYASGQAAQVTTGSVTLAGALDYIDIAASTATDSFDAGSWNIAYEVE